MSKNTKFLPGVSGNPKGRKPGNATAQKLRESIAQDLPDILSTLTRLAKSGDVQAAKLLMDRCLPALKPQASAFTLDTIPSDTLATTGQLIIDSIMRGEVPSDTGAMLINSLANQAKILEFTEMEARILALEGGSK
ncbi:MAG: DUF5681 domain-containing protein [Methylobacter sp.]|nr:DUF5681 domain-containing protein [Methylobacter sp.]